MSGYEHIVHTLPPVYDKNSRVLILGTMPSPKSRTSGFYYGHPQNRFWRVLSTLFSEPLPADNHEKTAFLLTHRIALWDVLQSCDIRGASDASIRNAQPNDIAGLVQKTPVRAVFTTGQKAFTYYQKYCRPDISLPVHLLPSTSAANAAYSFERLLNAYSVLLDYLL